MAGHHEVGELVVLAPGLKRVNEQLDRIMLLEGRRVAVPRKIHRKHPKGLYELIYEGRVHLREVVQAVDEKHLLTVLWTAKERDQLLVLKRNRLK